MVWDGIVYCKLTEPCRCIGKRCQTLCKNFNNVENEVNQFFKKDFIKASENWIFRLTEQFSVKTFLAWLSLMYRLKFNLEKLKVRKME